MAADRRRGGGGGRDPARPAALAFEGAVVATVPLPAVLANRARLLILIATNFFGQNTAAIAQTELEYVEMWAQDVAAMVGYHAGAQTLVETLPAFTPPPAGLGGGAASAGLAGLADLVTAPLTLASQFFQGLSSLGTAFASQLQSVFMALSPAVSSLTSLMTSTPVATLTTVAQAGMYPAGALMPPMVALAQSTGPVAAAAPAAPAPILLSATNVAAAEAPRSAHSVLSDLQPLAGGGWARWASRRRAWGPRGSSGRCRCPRRGKGRCRRTCPHRRCRVWPPERPRRRRPRPGRVTACR